MEEVKDWMTILLSTGERKLEVHYFDLEVVFVKGLCQISWVAGHEEPPTSFVSLVPPTSFVFEMWMSFVRVYILPHTMYRCGDKGSL